MSEQQQRADMLESFRDTFQTIDDTSYSDLEGDINVAKVPSDDTYLLAKFQKSLPSKQEKILVRLSDLSDFGLSINDLRSKGMVYNDEYQRWEEIEAPASAHVDMTGFATTNSGGSNESWDDDVTPKDEATETRRKPTMMTINPPPQLTVKTTCRMDDITDMSGFDSDEESHKETALLQLPSHDRHTDYTHTDIAADTASTPLQPSRIEEEEDEDFDPDFAIEECSPPSTQMAPSTTQASVYLKKVFGANKSSGPRLIRPDDYNNILLQQTSVPATTPTTTDLTPPPPDESWDNEFDFEEEGEAVTKLSLKMPLQDVKAGASSAPAMVFDRAALRWTAVHGGAESAEFDIEPSPNGKLPSKKGATSTESPAKAPQSAHTRRSTAEDFVIDAATLRQQHEVHMGFVYQFLGEASYHKLLAHHSTPNMARRSTPRKGTPTGCSPLLSRSFFQSKELHHSPASTLAYARAMEIFAQYTSNSAPSHEDMPSHISKRKLFVFDELTKEFADYGK